MSKKVTRFIVRPILVIVAILFASFFYFMYYLGYVPEADPAHILIQRLNFTRAVSSIENFKRDTGRYPPESNVCRNKYAPPRPVTREESIIINLGSIVFGGVDICRDASSQYIEYKIEGDSFVLTARECKVNSPVICYQLTYDSRTREITQYDEIGK